MAGSISTFPGNCVVLIESPDPLKAGYYLQGSGVVIGPHTILTASHVVYDISEQTPLQNIELYPAWNSADPALGPGYIPTAEADHYYEIGTFGSDALEKAQSVSDYAVIDTSYTFSNWMGVLLNYAGGSVTATGYPAGAGGYQTDSVGTVSADPSYSVLDYGTLSTSNGNSGGPLWLDYNGSDDVAGVVSTGSYACQLTTADWSQIESWVSQDGYGLGTSVQPAVTAVPSVSLVEGQSISAPSLIASVSNPNGDAVTEDIYEDLGGGSGYFTLNGVRQPDNEWIYAGPSDDVQYVAGASPGNDTLGVGIHDSTTNSNFSTSLVATTIYVAPIVTAVPSVSLAEGQSIPASSLIASVSNPSGDDLVDTYEDLGGGSGYFTLNGVRWPDGMPIYAFSGDDVQYVGGPSPGVDTLRVGVDDFTTNTDIYASNSVVATTTPAAGAASDILLQNANGQAAIWATSATTLIGGGAVNPNPGPSWHALGTGDFFGGGDSDILWQNVDGQAAIWEMNGMNIVGGGAVAPSPGQAWQAVGTGDFNGDGLSDILWQNTTGQVAVWEMSGASIIGGGTVAPNPGPAWKAVGTGDFNHDGHSDILWQNANGQAAIWDMNGSTLIGGGVVAANPGPAWKLVGSGDFFGAGDSDLLWQNTSSGQVAIWDMNGTNIVGGGVVSANPGPSWHAIGTNGGGSILFQNTSGQTAIWEMNGANIVGGGAISPNPGSAWKAIGLT